MYIANASEKQVADLPPDHPFHNLKPKSAAEIAAALGGTPSGEGTWMAFCPAHDNTRTPALAVTQWTSGPLVHCHAGCTQRDVIAALHARGLWGAGAAPRMSAEERKRHDAERAEKSRQAVAIWEAAQPAQGTVVETYLRSRGINLIPPPSLRFAVLPLGRIHYHAMVALVTNAVTGKPQAVHRTFLMPDGSGKAPLGKPKMMLGPCAGGVVNLGHEITTHVVVTEGIEDALSVMQIERVPTVAALSTSGMTRLKLPPSVRDVTIAADGDEAGEKAARELAARLATSGVTVRIAWPPAGQDFNDVLMGNGNV